MAEFFSLPVILLTAFSLSLSLSLLSLSDVPKKEWMNHSETRETEQLSIGYTSN